MNVECDQVQIIALTRAEIGFTAAPDSRTDFRRAGADLRPRRGRRHRWHRQRFGAPSRVVFPDGGERPRAPTLVCATRRWLTYGKYQSVV